MKTRRLRTAGLVTIAALGALLRMLYAVATPYWTHAYDWQGHQQYIRFLLENGHLPSATFGWETFQPPLYYVTCALWLKYTAIVGFGYGSLQSISVAISIATLLVGLWIGILLLKENLTGALIFGLIMAVFPGLVVLASQISNDGLVTLLLFIVIGLLLRWNEYRQTRDVIAASIVLGLAILTKSTALLLIPVLVISIVTASHLSKKRMAILLSATLMSLVIITGWFFVLRFGVEGQTSLVGNETGIHKSIIVPLAAKDFVTFNPFTTINFPFTDDLTTPRREILFERLIKTAHFGHHYFAPIQLASTLIVSGLAMLVLMLFGMRSQKFPGRIILVTVFVVLIVGVIAHRFRTPSIANAHFRFIVPIIIPVIAFAVHAATDSRKKYMRIALVGAYASLCFAVTMTLLRS